MFSHAVLKIALMLALLPGAASAEDALQRPGWKLRVWPMREWLLSAVSPKAKGTGKLHEKAKLAAESKLQSDAMEWWRAAGVIVPEGGRAIFDKTSKMMMMFAPNEIVDQADAMIGSYYDDLPVDIMFEISLVECAFRRDLPLEGLSYDDLRKVAGTTWLEREHVLMRGRIGQRLVIERTSRQPTLKRLPLPVENGTLAGDRGLAGEMDAILGPDETTFELNLIIRHWGPIGANGPTLDASITTSMTTANDVPTVVAMWTVAPAENAPEVQRRVVLVVRPRLLNYGGWPATPRKP